MECFVSYQVTQGTALITLNRPATLNALNHQILDSLASAFDRAEADPDVCSVILTGSGKAFVAGADIAQMQTMNPQEAHAFSQKGGILFDRIEFFSKPVVAAVNGYALGGGCELALACDCRIASARAVFGQPEVRLGIIPGFGGCKRLDRIVGASRAREMVFSGQTLGAAAAKEIGLVDEVTAPDELMRRAHELTAAFNQNSLHAIQQAKRIFQARRRAEYQAYEAVEYVCFADCFAHPDQHAGMTAFLQKRSPEFKKPAAEAD